MSAAFDRAARFVLDREGAYSNSPDDPGGETRLGIIQDTLDEAIAQGIEPKGVTLRELTADRAIRIYRELYWNRIKGDQLPASIALAVFDMSVNHGVGFAARTLQSILGVTPDSVIGPKTIAAAEKADPRLTLIAICDRRLDAYFVSRGATTYLRGWIRRLFRVMADSLSLLTAKGV